MYACVLLLIAIGVGIYLWKFLVSKTDQKALRLLFIVLLLAVTPIGTTLICVMEPTVYFHLLMRLPWALFFVFVLALAERIPDIRKEALGKIKGFLAVAVCVLTLLMVSQFAITANVVSFNMEERYEKTYGLCLRILDRLEQMPEYQTGDKVAVIGGGVDQREYPYTDVTSEYLKGYFGAEGVISVTDTGKFASFLYHYLNVTITTTTTEEELSVLETQEFKQMKSFPDESSIQKIGEIWVVKLNG